MSSYIESDEAHARMTYELIADVFNDTNVPIMLCSCPYCHCIQYPRCKPGLQVRVIEKEGSGVHSDLGAYWTSFRGGYKQISPQKLNLRHIVMLS